MKILFNNIVYAPDTEHILTVNGKVKHITLKQQGLLEHLLQNNGRLCEYQQILDAVWGPGERSFEILHKNKSTLSQLLKPQVKIKTIRNKGYILTVDLQTKEAEYPKTERLLEKSPYVKHASTVVLLIASILSFVALGTLVNKWLSVASTYKVAALAPAFIYDHVGSLPQLSPDGHYVAYRKSNGTNQMGHLILLDRDSGKARKLAKMRFDDGFKWDWSGNRIVYQIRTTNSCEVRLLLLDEGKSVLEDNLLTQCLVKSGQLSFAWHSNSEFYVNLVDKERPGVPLHHLYRFDINSKKATKVLTAKQSDGLGYYSLEYDKTTNRLYMLKTSDFINTGFYRFDAAEVENIAEVNHLVRSYTVFNNQLIYKNAVNELVLNVTADDFTTQQILLPSPLLPIKTPHFNGNELVFMMGDTMGFVINQWTDNRLSEVDLAGFNPSVIAEFDNTLVFASNQTGSYQIYQLTPNGQVVQLSDQLDNEKIKTISVTADILAVSYYNQVSFYRYGKGQLLLLNTVTGYTNGFLSADGKRALLSREINGKATGHIIEMQLVDMTPTPLEIHEAVAALYYQGEVIYIDKHQQLLRYGDEPQVITTNLDVAAFEHTTLTGNLLYYITTNAGESAVQTYDFNSGEHSRAAQLQKDTPTRLAVVNGVIYMRLRQTLKPKLMLGEVKGG